MKLYTYQQQDNSLYARVVRRYQKDLGYSEEYAKERAIIFCEASAKIFRESGMLKAIDG